MTEPRPGSVVPGMPPEAVWVAGEPELERLVRALEGSRAHALDSESNSGFAYRERLCLLQFNVGETLWLVDLLALSAGAFERLRPALESSERTTWVHGGEFDVGCLKRDYDLRLRGVWDSQQAAAFLGWSRTGYGATVERLLGVGLEKGLAHFDWACRPLPAHALEYALDDVRYLPEVCRRLAAAIEEADLVEELEIANQAVMTATWSGADGDEAFWRIKGLRELPPVAQARAARLHAWREAVAQELDRPPGRVLNNRALLAVSRQAPRRLSGLARCGVPGGLRRARGGELLALIQMAGSEPPPRPTAAARQRRGRAAELRERRLKLWRRNEAERRGVPLQVVLPAKALEHLGQLGAEDLPSVPQLGGKRIRLYGATLRRLCADTPGDR